MSIHRTRSEQLFAEAVKLFPGGVNSPVRAFRSVGGTPLFFARGEGAEVVDADGNRFIDLCHSWGPLILGHAHPAVVEAITRTAAKGSTFGAPTEEENLLASFVMARIPFLILRCFAQRSLEGRTNVYPGLGSRHRHRPRYDSTTRGSAETWSSVPSDSTEPSLSTVTLTSRARMKVMSWPSAG